MLPEVAVHVIQRGNNRSPCFFKHEDWAFYLFHLGRMLPRARCRLHAYCLMTNHVHLLITAEEPGGCGLLMKSIGQLHAQYINKTYKRSGNLWQGRFKSCLVQSEEYALACYRYIELNPVRAGLVRRADEYPWSSYCANAKGEQSELLTAHDQYVRLGRTAAERQAVYRDLFGSAQATDEIEQIRSATNGGYALGNASFKRRMSRVLDRRVEKGVAGRPARAVDTDKQLDMLGPK